MPHQEDRYRAMLFETPELIPVSVGILPAAWMQHREQLEEVTARHPSLFGQSSGRDFDAVGGTYVAGDHVDAWGCVWQNVHTGRESIVTGHPVPTRADVRTLQQPTADIGFPHGFMYLRLQDLRGFEELMIDFAEEPEELGILVNTVLQYNLRQVARHLPTIQGAGQIIGFGDDLGMQAALPMSPAQWRKVLKPCFEAIYRPYRDAGHYVFMHTDGHIWEIIPDLVDCGVNVVNPQVRANGLDNLARVCKGKVCVALDLDRQMFPFCTPAEVDAHVREAVETLGSKAGGLWLSAEIGDDVPLDVCDAIFTALERYRGFYA